MWTTILLVLLIGAVLLAQVVGLIPDEVVPWILAGWTLAWAYFCVVRAGYPLLPTAAWAVPVALAPIGVFLFDLPVVVGWLGLGVLLAMWLSASVRRFWYGRVFRWRPDLT